MRGRARGRVSHSRGELVVGELTLVELALGELKVSSRGRARGELADASLQMRELAGASSHRRPPSVVLVCCLSILPLSSHGWGRHVYWET